MEEAQAHQLLFWSEESCTNEIQQLTVGVQAAYVIQQVSLCLRMITVASWAVPNNSSISNFLITVHSIIYHVKSKVQNPTNDFNLHCCDKKKQAI